MEPNEQRISQTMQDALAMVIARLRREQSRITETANQKLQAIAVLERMQDEVKASEVRKDGS
jgi:hypothetical protein